MDRITIQSPKRKVDLNAQAIMLQTIYEKIGFDKEFYFRDIKQYFDLGVEVIFGRLVKLRNNKWILSSAKDKSKKQGWRTYLMPSKYNYGPSVAKQYIDKYGSFLNPKGTLMQNVYQRLIKIKEKIPSAYEKYAHIFEKEKEIEYG